MVLAHDKLLVLMSRFGGNMSGKKGRSGRKHTGNMLFCVRIPKPLIEKLAEEKERRLGCSSANHAATLILLEYFARQDKENALGEMKRG